jgi:DNA-binding NarL/FixJ family response regulator
VAYGLSPIEQTSLGNEDMLPVSGRSSQPSPQRLGGELPARILIVDDHLIARTSIRRLLDRHPFRICGEARDGREAIEKVIELKPDIILLDISMPVMDGITAAHEIRVISPETKIVFLTSHDVPAFRNATQMLSDAFVSKANANADLIPVLTHLAETPPNTPPMKSRRAASS